MRATTRTLALLAAFSIFFAGPRTALSGPDTSLDSAEPDFLSRTRQLTFEGRRAGEGYFNPQGTKLVLQSEREPGNPFYQIYVLDLTTGDSHRVSPGMGKTTCAFFDPRNDDILFASTHHDPRSLEYQMAELEARAEGRQKRYAWDYDPEMELYVASHADGTLRRMTEVRGYDAEGSYSPDGEWIVFSSTRSAYGRELTDRERRQLNADPSWFADLYVMRSDGSDLRRLTDTPGYDGGPFFMPDGKRIVWRRFDERGLLAEIWTIALDGSDERQLTEFESMSWAPYPHPTGGYIIFTSNKLGFENFELFIVDAEGRKQPVRVTYTDGFDGLPVFSPDGTNLAWTSTRRSKGGQIFYAKWNHEQALKALRAAPDRNGSAPRAAGREADHLAARLAEAGLVPLPGRDGLLFPFEADGGRKGINVVGQLPADSAVQSGDSRGVVVLGARYGHGAAAGEGASGVAAALVATEMLAAGPKPRPVIVALWGDSHAFIEQEHLPTEHVEAYVNLGAVGRVNDNRLTLRAVGSSEAWPRLIEQANVVTGFDVAVEEEPYLPNDAGAFYAVGVPVLDLSTGARADDRAASETAERIDDEDLERVARFAALLVRKSSALERRPEYRDVAREKTGGAPHPAARAFTGTVPDYAAEAEGLRLSGVIEGGPAEQAGLREGDVIVAFGDHVIANAYDYRDALQDVVIGQPVRVVFVREGQRHTVEMIPTGRR